VTSRNYRSPLREAEAAATRARIVDAAGELFTSDGYAATPLRAVAEKAGVSVQSVHLAGPKYALLLAAYEKSFAGDEGAHSLTERPAVVEMMSNPDTDAALHDYVGFLVDANGKSAQLWHVLHVAADGDSDIRAEVSALDKRRRADLKIAAGWMLERGLIREDEATAAATELAFFTSPDAYLHFVANAGWSAARYGKWLEQSIRSLIAPRR
jgi:AcrR family transcriptional regulator